MFADSSTSSSYPSNYQSPRFWLRRMTRIPRPVRLLIFAVVVLLLYLDRGFVSPDAYRGGGGDGGAGSSSRSRTISMVKTSFDWSKLQHRYPVESFTPLPAGKPRRLPRVQHKFTGRARFEVSRLESRRQEIRKVFKKCWGSYKKYAWMKDELAPLSAKGKTTFGGWAATMIDSLDTLWIMGLKDEFYEAVEAVGTIDWESTPETACNIFETTIRHLGGLLSAYDLSQERVLLDKAIELGDMLYAGFDTPNRMPPFWLDFKKAKSGGLVAEEHQPSASPCSLSLEFTRLSQLTGDPKYYDAIARITDLLDKHQYDTMLPGMWPTFINMRDLVFNQERTFTIGALADSLYEYLPKMYAMLGGLEPVYEKLYKGSMETIKENILFRPMLPDKADVLFSGTARVNHDGQISLNPEGQHLSCFAGGMFALGGRLFGLEDHVEIGAKLAKGCIYAYNAFPTGIMPEVFNMIPCDTLDGCEWDEERWEKEVNNKKLPKGFVRSRDKFYLLRPEAIESVFLLYRITGRKEFQEAAWQMFQSIQKATETEYGNAGIDDVTVTGETKKRDSMEVSTSFSCDITNYFQSC